MWELNFRKSITLDYSCQLEIRLSLFRAKEASRDGIAIAQMSSK